MNSDQKSAALALLLFVALILACATTQSLPVEDRSRIFEGDYPRVFRAFIDVLTEEGYAVTGADRETGVVTTEYRSNSALAAAFIGEERTKVTALFTETEEGTRVVVTISVEAGRGGGYTGSPMTGDSARKYYSELFDKVAGKL